MKKLITATAAAAALMLAMSPAIAQASTPCPYKAAEAANTHSQKTDMQIIAYYAGSHGSSKTAKGYGTTR